MGKYTRPELAFRGVRDGSIVAISGFNAATTPFYLIESLIRY